MDAISLGYSPAKANTAATTGAAKNATGQTGVLVTSSASTARWTDTVQISKAATVQSLKKSGSTVQQIASALALTTAEVDQELGITTSPTSAKASEVAVLLS